MKNFLFWTAVIAAGVFVGSGLANLTSTYSPFTIQPSTSGGATKLEYQDFISIMLTAVSVILAALGFVIALLAFIGWNSIGDRVSSLAKTFLKDAMEEGGELHSLVKTEAKEIIYRGVEPVDTDFNEDEAEDGN